MADIFLKIFNMSVSACWIVLAVILFRAVLKKAPKWVNCVLWGIAGLRLGLPFSFESLVGKAILFKFLASLILDETTTEAYSPLLINLPPSNF